MEDGVKTEITGLPPVYVRGQGGLLDIAISPDYATTGIIYFTTSSPLGEEKGGHTALYSTQIENKTLVNTKLLYKGDYNTKKANIGDREFHLIKVDICTFPLAIVEIEM